MWMLSNWGNRWRWEEPEKSQIKSKAHQSWSGMCGSQRRAEARRLTSDDPQSTCLLRTSWFISPRITHTWI